MALIYIIGSAFIMGISYSLTSSTKEKIEKVSEDLNYMLIKNVSEYKLVSSEKDDLGVNFQEKSRKLIKLCKEECGINLTLNNNKGRKKIIRYIRDYDRMGKVEFIRYYNKK
jgi:hypothetical protein|tara:strand:- start:16 stop:351 length:336 start_codon:yes stop_codon:yes gene_type:complete